MPNNSTQEMGRRKNGEGTVKEYKPGKWFSQIKIDGRPIRFYGTSENEVIAKMYNFQEVEARPKTEHRENLVYIGKQSAQPKRRKGEGMITEYEPGKWFSQIKINGRVFRFYAESEKEARKKLDEFKNKRGQGLTDSKRITYSDFLDEWLEDKKLRLKPQSYDRLVSTIETHIKPTIGFYNLASLDKPIIQDELINLKSKTLSFSSVKKIYDAANESLRYARSMGKIVHNPVDLVSMPTHTNKVFKRKGKPKKSSLEIFTEEEIGRFEEAARAKYNNGAPIYPNGEIFILMLNSGLRIGEATAIKWSDYDEEHKTLKISATMVTVKDEDEGYILVDQDSTKTEDSERVLRLNEKAVAALPKKRSGEYIYCTRNGDPIRPRHIQNKLDSILNRAGLEHKSTHVFRHTFASLLFARGYDVKVISEILGHSSVKVTYNTYISLIKEQKAKALAPINDLY